jgi:hypothetical protein
MKHILIINSCIFFFGILSAGAQEVLLPLENNPIKQYVNQKNAAAFPFAEKSIQKENELVEETINTLPFWDDFSYNGPYPDPKRWADRNVFINSSYAIHSKTIGVATFDALDQHGNIYEHIEASNTPFVADYLTSQPIRLDSVFSPAQRILRPGDSVVLSFYYQPQGMGGNPLYQDSLVLEFLHTPGHFALTEDLEVIYIDDVWLSVWKASGEHLEEFSNDTFPYFKRVAIPITDEAYFRDDFRFRFKNHVSFPLPGNPTLQNNTGMRALWNIDYVYLNHSRNMQQTNYFDIAFTSPPQSILKHYTSMPWSHYIIDPQKHLRSNFSMSITNLDQVTYPYSYRYFIQDENGVNVRNYSGGNWNIDPFISSGYQRYQPHANPIVIANPLPTAPADERHFNIVHVIRAGVAGDSRPRNDTVTYRQSFHNFFSYDDGIPEAGYGVLGRFPRIAKQFVAGKPDNIHSVDIYFNKTMGTANTDRPFKIMIWKKLAPQEEVLYQSEHQVFTSFEDDLNQFIRLELGRAVEVSDTFYVGIEQQGVISINEFLSIGFDRSNDSGKSLFFTSGGEWMQSIHKGSLMIRPVVGANKTATPITEPSQKSFPASLYPNPVSGNILSVELNNPGTEEQPVRVDIIDMYGRLVYSGDYRKTLDVSHMVNGIYFMRFIPSGNKTPETESFIIAR